MNHIKLSILLFIVFFNTGLDSMCLINKIKKHPEIAIVIAPFVWKFGKDFVIGLKDYQKIMSDQAIATGSIHTDPGVLSTVTDSWNNRSYLECVVANLMYYLRSN